ncbi:sigma-54-dependent Fis family transcriptional regulator [Roseomonas sp. PWR1]|uniref:Sigma-54-dependent Fis family transcriptional regulator n=1 Tax=Roseomonas nitratireducens TaxID=2820810 RepID=A0ABS4AQK8_9PROT|nr:sigma-54 dependent transcriptional regulator [Neoroseomonas nitratireducens]MBP0462852.1 sigma-54-dependent Fis family transcriptional regulator [Neoroseomonas nitratireducens]
MPQARLLLVEDTLSLATLYREYLRGEGHAIQHASTLGAAREALAERPPDAVLLDLRLPDGDGLGLLAEIRAAPNPPPVVVMTAHGSVSVAVDAMRAGASDFLVKPFPAERLVVTVANVLERAALRREVATLAAGAPRGGFAGFIGAAPAMQTVYRILENAAPSRATVFVTGESGTGKELAAEAVHALSPRSGGAFVALNCAAIPKDLIESEIFGHVRGAFTGAVADRPGAARAADGGTLFLDELCEMDLALQGKLLRFIQTGSFVPVGASKPLRTDVRFVCATNRDPLEEVRAGRFREDLYYRLHVVPVALPPLRERGEDVILLADAFLARSAAEEGKRFARFAPDALALLRAHRWPGNVRELENAIRTAVVLHDAEEVTAAMLPVTVHGGAAPPAAAPGGRASDPARRIRPLAEVEREAIEEAVRLCGGNIPKAAAFLGVSPSTLYRKREAWGGQRG